MHLCKARDTSPAHPLPRLPRELGCPPKISLAQVPLITSVLTELQVYEGLLGQLQEEYSALLRHKVCLAKMLVVASRSPRLPPVG